VIVEEISHYFLAPVEGGFEDRFEALAGAAFAYQFERLVPYRTMCERAGKTPETVASWRDVPMIPATAFASLELATDPPLETFRSSGTLDAGGKSGRSVHRHPFPELYRAAVDASFPRFCLPRGDRPGDLPAMLSLVPPRTVAPDSSLGFMVDHLMSRFGGPGSDYAFGVRGVEGAKARSWFGARQREGRPAMILATSIALADLLDFLARIDLRFRLPAGSAVFETGGFKGREREVSREELHGRLANQLAIPSEAIVGEYGMTELTSQGYTATLSGGAPDVFVLPHWMRVRVLDPVTLAEVPAGETGLLAFFDLANVGSALHLLTEDLGSLAGDGFRLAGRAADADLRGCSLLAEELGRSKG
jgi:hypothetical protein